MFARLIGIPKRFPLLFSVAYGGAKTIAADVLVQKKLEGREDIDWDRSMVFLGFGLFQVGFVQYMIYSKFFPFIFPGAGTFSNLTFAQKLRDIQGIKNVCKQVSVDMFIYHPCLYFPVFYTCQEIVAGNVQDPTKTVSTAVRKYVPNAVDDWIGLWKIFFPVSIFQNSFCPVYLRVPCVATVGFFYCIILSMTRGDELSQQKRGSKAAAEAANKAAQLSDAEFEDVIAKIRARYQSKEGVERDEFSRVMGELGLGEASKPLFDALDDIDGVHPRGSGVVSTARLADGLKMLAERCSPD